MDGLDGGDGFGNTDLPQVVKLYPRAAEDLILWRLLLLHGRSSHSG